VEHGEVGVGAFFPASEDAAEAVEPGVGSFDDPTAGAEAGLTFERFCLFAASADVRGEAELGAELAHFVVVVGGVEAQSLRPLPRRLRPLDRDRLERRPGEFVVV
jgi:hypothetical protein